jgi:excisionase family DNA binding protein
MGRTYFKPIDASIEPREVMDVRQCANYLGLSEDTLYMYAQTGFVPAFKLGNRWRFKMSLINEWIDRKSKENLNP